MTTKKTNKTSTISRRAVIAASGLLLSFSLGVTGAYAELLDKVLKDGTITVGIHNRAPWGFQGENGEATGFSPDLVRAAFEPLGVTNVRFIITEFGALIPGLTARRFDAIASGLYITPERCGAVAFSDPDLSLKDAVLVAEGNPKNIHSYADIAADSSIRFGVSRGSANAANAAEAGVPESQTILLQDTESTVAALVGGRVDVISFAAPTVIGLLNDENIKGVERAEPFEGLVLPSGNEKSGYSAIAFHPEDTDLRDAYNKRLAEMKADGTMTKIMEKYGFTDAETAPELTYQDICDGKL